MPEFAYRSASPPIHWDWAMMLLIHLVPRKVSPSTIGEMFPAMVSWLFKWLIPHWILDLIPFVQSYEVAWLWVEGPCPLLTYIVTLFIPIVKINNPDIVIYIGSDLYNIIDILYMI